ncbi:endolytic transglycosylase MltG [Candidatus Uhrbacteria bacterium]|nr:MAG: endolytic transglycosylase MltG [Candidatus Uhrbacteria bacterium]
MKRILFASAALVLLLAGFGWWFASEAWFGRPTAPEPIPFTVDAGRSGREVVADLAAVGIIPSAWRYRLYGYLDRSVSRPKAGAYQLRPGQSYREIARTLAIGPARREVEVRIVEGWTVDQIASHLESAYGVSAATTTALIGRAANRSPFDETLRADYPFLRGLPRNRSLEGYLFPDTYRVWGDQLPDGLVRKQLDEFGARFATTTVGTQSAPLKTLDEVVILASIVEAEVREPRDRRLVAGIFLNRLQIGMPLQTDASISYLTGSGRARSTAADLAIDSPFNTYKYPGLPPAPINNPGEDVIRAVLDPAPSDYFYFLSDAAGNTYYARTLEEHAANRRRAGF